MLVVGGGLGLLDLYLLWRDCHIGGICVEVNVKIPENNCFSLLFNCKIGKFKGHACVPEPGLSCNIAIFSQEENHFWENSSCGINGMSSPDIILYYETIHPTKCSL